jgi:hypothetical protein
MADFAEIAEGQVQGPPDAAPRTSSRGKSPVSQRPSKTVSDSRSAAQTKTTKKRKGSSPKSRKNKRNKFTRRYSASSSSSESSDTSSSSDSDSDVSDVSSRPASQGNTSIFVEPELDHSIVAFAADAAFQGLSKSARRNLTKETPVPAHSDLRPKKVDSFVKKFLKRNGTTFNPIMDRRQMNLAGRVLDCVGPLSQLWQNALRAQKEETGLAPALVIDLVRRALALAGNASYCALVDRRKGLLAKVSSESVDLIGDSELFSPGSSDVFGKKFKKAFLKELKLSKELDSLARGKNRYHHGNYGKQKPFRRQPGHGPGPSSQFPRFQRSFRGRFPYRKPNDRFQSQGSKN